MRRIRTGSSSRSSGPYRKASPSARAPSTSRPSSPSAASPFLDAIEAGATRATALRPRRDRLRILTLSGPVPTLAPAVDGVSDGCGISDATGGARTEARVAVDGRGATGAPREEAGRGGVEPALHPSVAACHLRSLR